MKKLLTSKIFTIGRIVFPIAILFCPFLTIGNRCIFAQGVGHFDRDSAYSMLDDVKDDLRNNYYDPNYRGMNVEARFAKAKEAIKQATSRDQLVVAIAQILLELDDSHTFFLPPFRAARVTYGLKMQMFGDDCIVTNVNPKSDAATKGLMAGAVVLDVDGYRPTRGNLWKMTYRYYALMPASKLRMTVRNPGESQPRVIEVFSKIEKTAAVAIFFTNIYSYNTELRYDEDRFHEQGDVIIWRMPGFDVSPDRVDRSMSRARKFKTLILDLRGNGGGYLNTLERLAGYFFDRDIKIGDLKSRKEVKSVVGKTRAEKGFKGQLIVLVDSESGSAAELFARVVQLEKRGTVIGDRTAGAVMASKSYGHETGVGGTLYYGASITIADVIMTDGKSLEHVGVQPDTVMLPSASDIASSRDPVLTHAATVAGIDLPPEKAGTLFPVVWLK